MLAATVAALFVTFAGLGGAWVLAEGDRPDLGGVFSRRLYDKLGVRSLFVSGSITEDFRKAMAAINPLGFLGKPVTRRTLGDPLSAMA